MPSQVDVGGEIGPHMPPRVSRASIGPEMPPGVGREVDGGDDDNSDDAGPSMPSSGEGDRGGGVKRNVGPALPAGVDLDRLAHETAKIDWQRRAIEEEEEELDLVGPALPGKQTIGYQMATEAANMRMINNMLTEEEREAEAAAPKHEGWMTMLPDVKPLSFTLDQSMSNRTFQRKEKDERGDTSQWTDTPADRARKAREREMGISETGGKRKAERVPSIDPAQTAIRLVEQYNQSLRPKSLVEIHQETLKKQKKMGDKGELVPGGWDRAEMNEPRGLDKKGADKMFQDAASLAGRFGNKGFHGI